MAHYKDMVSLIRAISGKALKTNEALILLSQQVVFVFQKESILRLNNFKILSITDTRFDEHFDLWMMK